MSGSGGSVLDSRLRLPAVDDSQLQLPTEPAVNDSRLRLPAEPAVNLLAATLVERLGRAVLSVCGQQMPVTALLRQRPGLRRFLDRPLVIGIRPEHLEDAMVGPPSASGTVAVLHGRVRRARPVRGARLLHVDLADSDGGEPEITVVARASRRSSGGVGDSIMLAMDTRKLVAIDAESGCRLW